MAAPAPPTIPPRPTRSQAAADHGVSKLPEIPPRPLPKRLDRSVSPLNYPRSPLNEPYALSKRKSVDLPPRPPSVHHLPTPGEEGMEYANIQYAPEDPSSALAQDAAAQTRRPAEDLKLHAPKPSLSKPLATAQVQAVTRTDSAQAASHGIGKTPLEETFPRNRSRGSFSRPTSASFGERRGSTDLGDEGGPAELGLRVPINPYLGDVQAPSPGGLTPQGTGESGKRFGRRKSAMDNHRPPDAYGLHGHGILPQDKFDREWYMKHPEQLEHEDVLGHGVYEGVGSGRGSYALSSDQLNQIVRNSASRSSGFGTSENIPSYPDEQIGYMASEVYQRSQQTTPQPELTKVNTHGSQANIESPLRRTSFPAEDATVAEIRRTRSQRKSDASAEDENEAHHVEPPSRRFNKITGGEESTNETQEARPYVSRGDQNGDYDYSVPILAEDEVAKDIGGEHMHPAISPKHERRSSSHDDGHASGGQTPTSRPSSRPGSIYNLHSASHSLSRFLSHQDEREHMHTPLEDVAEYEPLFTDEDGKKSMNTADRFKRRPESLRMRFPSQDIWEDAPNSSMYIAEVSTPDLAKTAEEPQLETKPTFELPEQEAARKEEVSEEEKQKLLSKEQRLSKSRFAPHLRDDMPTRPGIAPRFPSQDIWEDSPDSHQLVTTVSSPPVEEDADKSELKPPIPARPAKSRLGEGASPSQLAPSVAPSIPARPQKKVYAVPPVDAQLTRSTPLSKESSPTELKKTPSIPDRPKPQIPPRPARKPADDELTKVTSAGSADSAGTEKTITSPSLVKAKPQVPPRPMAGNFANIKGNFMNDLNKRLGVGPPKPKDKEQEILPEEVKPLEDARKGRARGPQRRAPAKAIAASAPAITKPKMTFAMFSPQSIWQIDDVGSLNVGALQAREAILDNKTTESDDTGPSSRGVEQVKETMSEDKIAQIDHAATADAPLPALLDTTPKVGHQAAQRPSDAPPVMASGLATNTAGEPADPLAGQDEDEDNNPEGELTRKTTASTITGDPLEKESSSEDRDAIPASKQTTATDSEIGDVDEKLERVQTPDRQVKATDEPIQIRDEQVKAAAPSLDASASSQSSELGSIEEKVVEPPRLAEGKKQDEAKEPMNEKDVNYNKLEEMTAQADGKLHAEEDPAAAFSSRKVVD